MHGRGDNHFKAVQNQHKVLTCSVGHVLIGYRSVL